MLQLLLLAVAAATTLGEDLPPSCSKPVYCDSDLLHYVQTARIFPDSKTFVDRHMLQDPEEILEEFKQLLNKTKNPTKEQLQEFVETHFDSEGELENWTPHDFTENPIFLEGIRDEELRQFAKDIHNIWPTLGREIKPLVFEKPERFSFIPMPNGFIIPGGRFKEIYYWDSYWIIEGLLIGGMKETAKGMIENLISLLRKLGHIPNGSRWYYQERSQPPLLSAMMSLYIRESGDIGFLRDNIDALQDELNYWLDSQIVTFDKGDATHTLLRYYALSKGPRPESYSEDYNGGLTYKLDDRKQEFYIDLKSAAESGWDFSSRWFVDNNGNNTGNLTNIHTKDIIPVDLNAIFANALQNMAYFEGLLNKQRRGSHWAYLAQQWRSNIEAVFWDEEDGVWYDYDMVRGKHRKYFYPSNVSPLWMGAVNKHLVKKHSARVLGYLQKSHGLDFPGGIPSSLIRSGEQWDFPNAWPPLVSIVVNALEALGTEEGKKVAFDVAQTWVRACHKGFGENKQMFEKYDAEVPGKFGGGGEYVVQTGFGWSNGCVLEFLAKYGRRMTAHDDSSYSSPDDIESKENEYTIDTKSQ
uniref:Trehalase n=1 Tax=Omphisa fuscidentalis TaxID=386629 RepID=A3RLQ5_9NEOP|nr:trehalase-1 [Omphisa fuscidentalis]